MNTERFSISFENESFEVVANVRQAGDEMLLLVHGLGGSKEAYYHVWDRSNFAEYSIVAIDLVGFGDSDKPSGFPYTMAAQARVVADVLARFADKKIHMIVHSMGCAIGLLLGDEILGSLEAFVNIEGNLIGVDCEFGSRGMVSVTRDVFAAEMWPKLQAKYADLPRGYCAYDATTADVMRRSAESLVPMSDSEKLLEAFVALECRKVYIYGSENVEVATVARVGSVPKVEIARSGHILMCDNPEDFYDELHKFITA